MNVLVTGASGFLGQRVVRSLHNRGCRVVVVSRPGGKPSIDDMDGIETREADLRTSPLSHLVEDIDVVVHLAAQVVGSDEARFAGTAVATERLLDAVRLTHVCRFVLVSSYSVYNWETARGALDEGAPTLTRPYGRDGYTVAKVWQERLVSEFAKSDSATGVAILRPGFIWGPGREDLAGAGLRLGPVLLVVGPRMHLPLTYVDNCAEAIATAVVSGRADGDVVNIVDGRGVRTWRYARFLMDLDPLIKVRLPLPYALGRALVAVLAVAMPRIFKQGGKLPGVLVPASYAARFRPLRHSAAKAQATLGWMPRTNFDVATKACLRSRNTT